ANLEATFSLQQVDGAYIPYQNGMAVPTFEKQNRQYVSLKGTWKKQRFAASHGFSLMKRDAVGRSNIITEAASRNLASFDDAAWASISIPGVENKMNTYPNVPENYEDGVFYRYKFTVSDSLKGKMVRLNFLSVNYVADVWLNDTYLGYHEGGYTPFAFDVSSKLNYGGAQNTIVVRVDNPGWGTRTDIVPFYTCDWFNYTGIIGEVYLEAASQISVIRTDVIPQDVNGSIKTKVVLQNKTAADKTITASITIYNANITSSNIQSEKASALAGSTAQMTGTADLTVSIPKDSVKVWSTDLAVQNPKLWSTLTPNLYIMKVTVKDGGSTVDEYYTQFGIRTVKAEKAKVFLNGSPVFLTGVARHEDHPVYGRSIPLDIIYSDLQKVKSVNATFLRTGHYPNNPYTYLLADRMGLAVLEEIPVWWFDKPEHWSIQNNTRHIHEQMFKEMVYKDMNRPSILFWSAQNESYEVNGRVLFLLNLKSEQESKFPDGRLLTQSAAADRPGPSDVSQSYCDVAGWTMYFGIFHGGTYYGGTTNFLLAANGNDANKPVLDTEYGYWSGEDGNNASAQVTVFNETFRAFKQFISVDQYGMYNDNGFVAGVTWWCIFDWYTYQQISRNGYQSMGLYKMDRTTAKPVAAALTTAYEPFYKLGGLPLTAVNNVQPALPQEYSLQQNFPNPFNPETKIGYSVPEYNHVKLSVYNVLGKEVAVLVNEMKPAGSYKADFSGRSLPSGVYLYRLETGKFSQTRKMTLIK
ncbi:MAG: glycoside hydrolase family 2 TIM barrel-domain containing protein, partial [Syntrophothermus sp.]